MSRSSKRLQSWLPVAAGAAGATGARATASASKWLAKWRLEMAIDSPAGHAVRSVDESAHASKHTRVHASTFTARVALRGDALLGRLRAGLLTA